MTKPKKKKDNPQMREAKAFLAIWKEFDTPDAPDMIINLCQILRRIIKAK